MRFVNSFYKYLSNISYTVGTNLGVGVITLNNRKSLSSNCSASSGQTVNKWKIPDKWYVIKKINKANVIKSN